MDYSRALLISVLSLLIAGSADAAAPVAVEIYGGPIPHLVMDPENGSNCWRRGARCKMLPTVQDVSEELAMRDKRIAALEAELALVRGTVDELKALMLSGQAVSSASTARKR